jgi:hypothetical protein
MKRVNTNIQIRYKSNIYWDFGLMLLGVLLAFAVCVFVFKWMIETGLVSGANGSVRPAAFSGAAAQDLTLKAGHKPAAVSGAYTSAGERADAGAGEREDAGAGEREDAAPSSGFASLKLLPVKGFAYQGQKDVSLMKIEMYAAKSLKIKKLIFDFDGYAKPSDLENMQLYLDGKFVAEVPFFEAKGKFENLNLNLESMTKYQFEVKGKIGDEAASGDRIQIGLKDAGSIDISAEDAIGSNDGSAGFGAAGPERFSAKDIDAVWPMWSGYVSVIGGHIK